MAMASQDGNGNGNGKASSTMEESHDQQQARQEPRPATLQVDVDDLQVQVVQDLVAEISTRSATSTAGTGTGTGTGSGANRSILSSFPAANTRNDAGSGAGAGNGNGNTSSSEPGQVAQRTTTTSINSINVDDLQGTAATNTAGITLAPQSTEARMQHKMRQQLQLQLQQPTMPARDIAADHQAAVALARQDIQDKSQSQQNTTIDSQSSLQLEAVATAVRKRKPGLASPSPSALASTSTSTDQVENTGNAAVPATAPSNPQRIPVGAFRIVTSASGRFAITNAAVATDALEATSSHHTATAATITTTTTTTTTTEVEPPALAASLVIESALVVQEDPEKPSSRRGNRSRNNRDTTTRQETENTTHPEPASSQLLVPSEAFQDDSGVILVTAEAPTLNDSVWALLKSRKGRIGIIILIAIVATFTVLGVTVWQSNEAKTDEEVIDQPQEPSLAHSTAPAAPTSYPTLNPTTAMPTAMPTTRPFRPLQDLTEETIAVIRNDSNSPQAKAWAWLQEDIRQKTGQPAPNLRRQLFTNNSSSFAQTDQFVQRFVLVTLYYATNGAGWAFQRFWLDHDTSECDWWPHTVGISWPYEQGPVVCHENGSYAQLFMPSNGLQSGPLPNELGMLSHLTNMDVSGNPGLTGAIPEPICEAIQDESNPLQVIMTCNASLTCDCGCQCV
jgi:hypothetical protein